MFLVVFSSFRSILSSSGFRFVCSKAKTMAMRGRRGYSMRGAATQPSLPEVAWSRKLNDPFEDHSEFQVAMLEGMRLAGLGYRLYKYINKEAQRGRLPIMNPFKKSAAGPRFGVPMGGLGAGTINRGWRGDFGRWYLLQGFPSYVSVDVNAFSVYVGSKTPNGLGCATVMTTTPPQTNKVLGKVWEYRLKGDKSTYHALFPRAWTDYDGEPDPDIRLVCRQVTPVIPHNYKESSYPCSVFEWEIINKGTVDRNVSIMLTWANGTGDLNDTNGGHRNRFFHLKETSERGRVIGVKMYHEGLSHENVIKEMQMQVAEKMKDSFKDKVVSLKNVGKRDRDSDRGSRFSERGSVPSMNGGVNKLCFAIGTVVEEGSRVTYNSGFVANEEASAGRLWASFNSKGEVRDTESSEVESKPGQSLAAALCVKNLVPAGAKKTCSFAVSWDMPVVRMYSRRGYYRRYTKFYGRGGDQAAEICGDALAHYRDWERQIDKWQQPILYNIELPIAYKQALFNELYYLTEGGTVWTEGEEGSPPSVVPLEHEDFDTIGKFGYLESMEYIMVNTYDVHFYASWALAMLWPKLELSLQVDFGDSCLEEYDTVWTTLHSSHTAKRKVRGAVPHDLGNPGDDPWYLVNSYNIQPINDWKDLNSKFVLQVYRDFILTKNKKFLAQNYLAIQECLARLERFDRDKDGMIENDGFPDQTYDTWAATGASAYSGGLWVAALAAAVEISEVLKYDAQKKKYHAMWEKARMAYTSKLWNGKYYDYDTSNNPQHDSIMADMMCGQWYSRACKLPNLDPDEGHIKSALKTIFEFNVKKYKNGAIGAVNGMRPDGKVDKCCLQSVEVWTGTTYGLAATMWQEGMIEEGLVTALGIINTTYEDVGYQFQTPEAWDSEKHYRAIGYMRPLAIWGMQYAWENGASQVRWGNDSHRSDLTPALQITATSTHASSSPSPSLFAPGHAHSHSFSHSPSLSPTPISSSHSHSQAQVTPLLPHTPSPSSPPSSFSASPPPGYQMLNIESRSSHRPPSAPRSPSSSPAPQPPHSPSPNPRSLSPNPPPRSPSPNPPRRPSSPSPPPRSPSPGAGGGGRRRAGTALPCPPPSSSNTLSPGGGRPRSGSANERGNAPLPVPQQQGAGGRGFGPGVRRVGRGRGVRQSVPPDRCLPPTPPPKQ